MTRRKVILDVDPGIDDAVALMWALCDPRLEVVAVTAVGGNVSPAMANRNVETLVGIVDPPKWPRIGTAVEPEKPLPADSRWLFGADGLGNAGFPLPGRANLMPAPKVLVDEIRAAAERVSIVCLGPLTNLARAFAMEPKLAELIDQVIIMGGTNGGPGNVTPAAEFNFFCDPVSAHRVLKERVTMTLVPLDVTQKVEFHYSLLSELPHEDTRVGFALQQMLPQMFRAYHQRLGKEHIHLHDAVTLALLLHPELFTVESARCDVETQGTISQGALVNDRRSPPEWRTSCHMATDVDASAVLDCIIRGLKTAGTATRS